MNRTVGYGALFLGVGLVAGVSLGSRDDRGTVHPPEPSWQAPAIGSAPRSGVREGVGPRNTAARAVSATGTIDERLGHLASQLATEQEERRRLQERVDTLTAELAALRAETSRDHPPASTADAGRATATEPHADAPAMTAAAEHASTMTAAGIPTTMENALLAAGLDSAVVADIKRRRDELSLSEIYLRDLATREGWVDSPTFAEEMAEIQRQRTSIRDEIGDDAFDRYLAALGHANRVAVHEVISGSPAAVAGLQPGDLVVRYGDTRIFAPHELVGATHGGTAGEPVQITVLRDGRQLDIEVARGPLGIHVGATQGPPW